MSTYIDTKYYSCYPKYESLRANGGVFGQGVGDAANRIPRIVRRQTPGMAGGNINDLYCTFDLGPIKYYNIKQENAGLTPGYMRPNSYSCESMGDETCPGGCASCGYNPTKVSC